MHFKDPPGKVFERLGTSAHGLSREEAKRRLEQYGPNLLPEKGAKPAWLIFLSQFKDPLVLILVLAAVVTFFVREYVDTAVIAAVVLLNAIIGFIQEFKADKAMQALKRMAASRATVLREDHEMRIDALDLVPGDIVNLNAGNKVPADLRIFDVRELQIDESMLTGESEPVAKQVSAIDSDVPLADQTNMAFMGSVVTMGRGKGIVVSTGGKTELGKISRQVAGTEKEKTPLQERLLFLTKIIGLLSLLVAVCVVLIGIGKGRPLIEMILFGISVAVAVIPEGLPIVITITMAVGLKRMAEHNAIIRKLMAVETLGSCNFICSDKTGTITENRMTVVKAFANGKEFHFEGTGYDPFGRILCENQVVQKDDDLNRLLLIGVLCNSANLFEEGGRWQLDGDPTEGALLVSARKAGFDLDEVEYRHELIDEISFSSQRKFMAMLYRTGTRCLLVLKGAPEKVLEMVRPAESADLLQRAGEMADEGLRVLGFAQKVIEGDCAGLDIRREVETGLQFAGLAAIIDPPRASAIQAILSAQESGIRVVMLTGDHKTTAAAIGRRIGLLHAGELVLTGQDLDQNPQDFLEQSVEKTRIYARVSPHHKLAIVGALQRRGNVVAVTGDGVNDAPALKKANIGVAMGLVGTDVAREAADMVLRDDNFASIYEAVKTGRVIFQNIRKVSFFLLSSGAGIALAIVTALVGGLELPFLATQVLWINLVTNGLQDIALAYEPGEAGIEKIPPRDPKENVLNRPVVHRIGFAGLILGAGTLFLFWLKLEQSHDIAYARTTALNTIVLFQFFHAWNSRSMERSVFRIPFFSNPFLLISLILSLLAQLTALYWPPLQFVLRTVPLDGITWLQTAAFGATIILFMEVDKAILRRRARGK